MNYISQETMCSWTLRGIHARPMYPYKFTKKKTEKNKRACVELLTAEGLLDLDKFKDCIGEKIFRRVSHNYIIWNIINEDQELWD